MTRELKSQLGIEFYEKDSGELIEKPVAVQTEVTLSIQFDMPIPVDDTGCHVKYTLPSELTLPEGLTKISSGPDNMMTGKIEN